MAGREGGDAEALTAAQQKKVEQVRMVRSDKRFAAGMAMPARRVGGQLETLTGVPRLREPTLARTQVKQVTDYEADVCVRALKEAGWDATAAVTALLDAPYQEVKAKRDKRRRPGQEDQAHQEQGQDDKPKPFSDGAGATRAPLRRPPRGAQRGREGRGGGEGTRAARAQGQGQSSSKPLAAPTQPQGQSQPRPAPPTKGFAMAAGRNMADVVREPPPQQQASQPQPTQSTAPAQPQSEEQQPAEAPRGGSMFAPREAATGKSNEGLGLSGNLAPERPVEAETQPQQSQQPPVRGLEQLGIQPQPEHTLQFGHFLHSDALGSHQQGEKSQAPTPAQHYPHQQQQQHQPPPQQPFVNPYVLQYQYGYGMMPPNPAPSQQQPSSQPAHGGPYHPQHYMPYFQANPYFNPQPMQPQPYFAPQPQPQPQPHPQSQAPGQFAPQPLHQHFQEPAPNQDNPAQQQQHQPRPSPGGGLFAPSSQAQPQQQQQQAPYPPQPQSHPHPPPGYWPGGFFPVHQQQQHHPPVASQHQQPRPPSSF